MNMVYLKRLAHNSSLELVIFELNELPDDVDPSTSTGTSPTDAMCTP